MTWIVRENVPELAEKVKRLMLEKVEERDPPTRIWLTDTVYCGRKKLFAMLGYRRERMTEQALNRLWLGLLIHAELEKLGIAREVRVEYMGIHGKIDCLAETGEPIEIKSARSIYITSSRYAESHIQQLSRYCLATGKETGILFYYVPGVKITSLPAYRYRFDLSKVEEETLQRIMILRKAEELRDPFVIPPTWHSDSFDNWECRKCGYINLCKQGSLSTL